jgi:hypothetical protein
VAEFCKQCADDLGFSPENNIPYDFVGLQSDKEWEEMEEGYGLGALCESCGFTVVNKEGECIASSCPIHGKGEDAER